MVASYPSKNLLKKIVAPLMTLALASVVVGLGAPASAATIKVTTTGDDFTPSDGSVSLREAIAALDAGSDLGDPDLTAQTTGAFGSADQITFDASVTGTINLGSFLPPITVPMVISGPGNGVLAVSGGGSSTIFFVNSGSGSVTISGLTLADGASQGGAGGPVGGANVGGGGGGAAGMGGALFVDSGTVTLTGLSFSSNQAVGGDGGDASRYGDYEAGGGGGYGANGGSPDPVNTKGGNGGNGGPFGATGGVGAEAGVTTAGSGGDGGGGGGGASGPYTSAAAGGFGGGGGGAGGADCGAGPAGYGGFGGGGGGGTGGLEIDPGTLGKCTVIAGGRNGGSFAGAGGTGSQYVSLGIDESSGGGGGGGAGLGGAVFVRSGSLRISASELIGNSAKGGSGGTNAYDGGNDGSPGQGKGGAIFIGNGASAIAGCGVTFSGNSATDAGSTSTDNADLFVDSSGSYINSTTPPSVTAPASSSVVENTSFIASFTASGGTGPYSFSLASGSLPTGMHLAADGTLSGTPTQTGSFPITVSATDVNSCSNTSSTYSLVVKPKAGVVQIPTLDVGSLALLALLLTLGALALLRRG